MPRKDPTLNARNRIHWADAKNACPEPLGSQRQQTYYLPKHPVDCDRAARSAVPNQRCLGCVLARGSLSVVGFLRARFAAATLFWRTELENVAGDPIPA